MKHLRWLIYLGEFAFGLLVVVTLVLVMRYLPPNFRRREAPRGRHEVAQRQADAEVLEAYLPALEDYRSGLFELKKAENLMVHAPAGNGFVGVVRELSNDAGERFFRETHDVVTRVRHREHAPLRERLSAIAEGRQPPTLYVLERLSDRIRDAVRASHRVDDA